MHFAIRSPLRTNLNGKRVCVLEITENHTNKAERFLLKPACDRRTHPNVRTPDG